jgi:hypothetical protein
VVIIPEDGVGIVNKKFVLFGEHKTLPDGSIVALQGEAGIQADTLAPGIHMGYWPWQYTIEIEDFVEIEEGKIGVVEARDGKFLPAGKVLAKMVECDSFQDARKFLTSGGQRGPQIHIMPPGTYRINTSMFTVTEADALEIEDNMVGVVTTREGAPLKTGEIAGMEVPGHNMFQDAQAFIDTGAGVANGTGDLYVQNDLEVDGTITGTLKVSGFDGTMYTALNGNLTAISGMFWSNTNSLLAIGDSVGNDGKLQLQKSSADTVANNSSVSQIYISVDDFGVVTSGFDSNYGQKMIIVRTGATGGTITTVGSQMTVSGDNAGAGTHTVYGQIITVSGTADTNYGLRVTVPTYSTSYAATFSGGNVGIGTTTPEEALDVNSDSIRIRTAQSPATAAVCNQGDIAWATDYIYVCVATNDWRRAALADY